MGKPFATSEEAVRWFGGVQSQDFDGAKWAVGQRVRDATDASVDDAFQEGRILRTHVLRPTWHFVVPEDIRWMLALTGLRVAAVMAYYNRQLGLDAATLKRSNAAIARALAGGNHLTRTELAQVLAKARIQATGQRLARMVMHAELDAVVCSGARRGKQMTYALLDERVPEARTMDRDRALAELTRRYFTSHGPATAHDFAWWSGLTVTDAKKGIEAAGVAELVLEGVNYRHVPARSPARVEEPHVHLLPNYDEFFIAYKDRSALSSRPVPKDDMLYGHLIFLNGTIAGGWHRTLDKEGVVVASRRLRRLGRSEEAVLQRAAERYARFLGVPLRSMIRF